MLWARRIVDESMGNHDGGFALHQTTEGLKYQLFGGSIEAGAGLIHNQDRSVADNRTGDGDALTLSA